MKLRLIYKTQKNTKRVKIHVEPETTIKMLKKNNRIARITDQDDFELLDKDRLGNVLDDNEIIVCYNCSETEDSEEKDMNENNEPEKRRVQVPSVNKTSESESNKKRSIKSKSVAAKPTSTNYSAAVSQKFVQSEDVNEAKENVLNQFSEPSKERHRNNGASSDRNEKTAVAEHLTPSPVKNRSVNFDNTPETARNSLLNTPINVAPPIVHENGSNRQFRKIRERNVNRPKEQIFDNGADTAAKMSSFKSFGKRENEKKLTLDDL